MNGGRITMLSLVSKGQCCLSTTLPGVEGQSACQSVLKPVSGKDSEDILTRRHIQQIFVHHCKKKKPHRAGDQAQQW